MSLGEQLLVEFTSDATLTDQGFVARFEFIHKSALFAVTEPTASSELLDNDRTDALHHIRNVGLSVVATY